MVGGLKHGREQGQEEPAELLDVVKDLEQWQMVGKLMYEREQVQEKPADVGRDLEQRQMVGE
jgi:hypothetical protein